LDRVVLGTVEAAPLVVVPVVVLGVRTGEVLGRVGELPQAFAVQGPRASLPDRRVQAPVDDDSHLEILPVLESGLRARVLGPDVPRVPGPSQCTCRLEIVRGEIVCCHQSLSPPPSMPTRPWTRSSQVTRSGSTYCGSAVGRPCAPEVAAAAREPSGVRRGDSIAESCVTSVGRMYEGASICIARVRTHRGTAVRSRGSATQAA